MGADQSKGAEEQQQLDIQLAQRLRAIELSLEEAHKRSDGDYVMLEKNQDRPPQYTRGSSAVSVSSTEQWEKELLEDPKNRLALSALSNTSAASMLTSRRALISDTQSFNIRIPLEGAPITNQRSSGRCWLFASTNVFRVALMRHHNLAEFELSQAYLFFWDKLEKANFFLEQIIDTADEELSGRLVQTLLSDPVGDGGQWDMVANLVEKYGLVPHSLYPDSFAAMNSRTIDSLITTKLREDALELRRLCSKDILDMSNIRATKEAFLREIHLILTLTLGPPPSPSKEFIYEFYDKDNKFQTIKKSPRAFASELSSKDAVKGCAGTDVNKMFSLVNDPRNEYMSLLTVNRLGNVVGGRGITYVNVDMATMKAACVRTLQKGIPIFFGSDVGKYSDSAAGIMDTKLVDYELGFNVRLGMSKAQRLLTGESAMTHAMVLTAVHLDSDEKPVRWRVQNSWGEAAGDKGWFVMRDEWMDQFVYQAVVTPQVVSKEVREVLKQKPTVLELWDPMGALA